VIYRHPLAYLIGPEGISPPRAFSGLSDVGKGGLV
jgi:hypothetical protein